MDASKLTSSCPGGTHKSHHNGKDNSVGLHGWLKTYILTTVKRTRDMPVYLLSLHRMILVAWQFSWAPQNKYTHMVLLCVN